MKIKFFVLSIVCIAFAGCCNYDHQEAKSTGDSPYHVFVENIRGHEYVVTTIQQGYGCGVSVVHSESCGCKDEKRHGKE